MSHVPRSVKRPDRPKVICDAFQKNPDGTWVSIRNNDLQTPIGLVRINPGIVFRPGVVQWGLEVVKTLEENCAVNTDKLPL